VRGWLATEQWQRLNALAELRSTKGFGGAAKEPQAAPAVPGGAAKPTSPEDAAALAAGIIDEAERRDQPVMVFEGLVDNVLMHTRWQFWAESEAPEAEPLPGDWKYLTDVQKLLVLRCFRIDRLAAGLRRFVCQYLGAFCVADHQLPLAALLQRTKALSPVLFVLSPGADPGRLVDAAAAQAGMSEQDGGLAHISLGQGQEAVAERALEAAFANGTWLALHNLHLMPRWGFTLEKQVQQLTARAARRRQSLLRRSLLAGVEVVDADDDDDEDDDSDLPEAAAAPAPTGTAGSFSAAGTPAQAALGFAGRQASTMSSRSSFVAHKAATTVPLRGFRLFLTAESADTLPSFLVQQSVKIVNEPPSGVSSNFLRAYQLFAHEPWELCTKPQELHSIIFSLCFFHAIVVERSKFGAIGWNRKYPFNFEDLVSCADVLAGYLEDRPRIPWDDLRFVFGEIMYGGHIVDSWDRRVCAAHLEQLVCSEVIEMGEVFPGLSLPTKRSHAETLQATKEAFPAEAPALFSMANNCAVRCSALEAASILGYLQPIFDASGADVPVAGDGDASEVGSADGDAHPPPPPPPPESPFDAAKTAALEMLALLSGAVPEVISLAEIEERLEDDGAPIQYVFLRECERMNRLGAVMRASIDDAEAAVKGLVTETDAIAGMLRAMRVDAVPEQWMTIWGPTTRPLASFTLLLTESQQQLQYWSMDLMAPKTVAIACFFQPTALIASILQDASARTGTDLDQLALVTEVMKKTADKIDIHYRDGLFIHGPALEGAVWSVDNNSIWDAPPKCGQMWPMPVMAVRAVAASKVDRRGYYACPVYRTLARSTTYVATLHLRTHQAASRWVLRGVALVIDAHT
jgi:dynein heavy chain